MVEAYAKTRYKVEYPGAEVLVAPGYWEAAGAESVLHDRACAS